MKETKIIRQMNLIYEPLEIGYTKWPIQGHDLCSQTWAEAGCQEAKAKAKACSILEAKALTLVKSEPESQAKAYVMKPKPKPKPIANQNMFMQIKKKLW